MINGWTYWFPCSFLSLFSVLLVFLSNWQDRFFFLWNISWFYASTVMSHLVVVKYHSINKPSKSFSLKRNMKSTTKQLSVFLLFTSTLVRIAERRERTSYMSLISNCISVIYFFLSSRYFLESLTYSSIYSFFCFKKNSNCIEIRKILFLSKKR